jgi:CDP-glucose 4,6-dehydratase
VLVTGHSGFKGSWLSLLLVELGAEVIGLSAPPAAGLSLYEQARVAELVEASEGDVRDAAAVHAAFDARPEVVVHLAAQAIVRRAYAEPAETYAINVTGTVNVLDAARATESVRSVVVVTSDKCYANTGADRPYSESDPLGGGDPYSSSKACQELVAAAYARSYFSDDDGARLATARAGNVIGGGDWGEDRLVPDAMRAARAREPVEVRNPDAIRPWQHALNPLSGYLLLAERLWESAEAVGAWNFGPSGEDERPVAWLIDRLAALWPGGIEVAGTSEIDAPPEAAELRLDSSRARELLGWRPRWGLDEALRAVVDWYSAHGEGRDMREVTLAQVREFTSG